MFILQAIPKNFSTIIADETYQMKPSGSVFGNFTLTESKRANTPNCAPSLLKNVAYTRMIKIQELQRTNESTHTNLTTRFNLVN